MRLVGTTVRLLAAFSTAVPFAQAASASGQMTARLELRGQQQELRLYGKRAGQPILVSSGDGGWMHLAPHVAQVLADHGFFVVGFDVRAYLAGFTSSTSAVQVADEPADYRALVEFAARDSSKKPILIGVSEGAGLSLLAATDPATKAVISGVIGLGLPDRNELAWRWKDALIYMTHRAPNEPLFSTRAIAEKVSPTPLAAIHSTHDEFVPLPEVQKIIDAAREPKKLWVVKASNHRFSDNLAEFDQRLFEAVAWVMERAPR